MGSSGGYTFCRMEDVHADGSEVDLWLHNLCDFYVLCLSLTWARLSRHVVSNFDAQIPTKYEEGIASSFRCRTSEKGGGSFHYGSLGLPGPEWLNMCFCCFRFGRRLQNSRGGYLDY